MKKNKSFTQNLGRGNSVESNSVESGFASFGNSVEKNCSHGNNVESNRVELKAGMVIMSKNI
jgi:hypothetical protein